MKPWVWGVALIGLGSVAVAQYFPPPPPVWDADVFPPLHASYFLEETDCGGGGITTAGTPEGWSSVFGPTSNVSGDVNGKISGLTTAALGVYTAFCSFLTGTNANSRASIYMNGGGGGAFNFSNGIAKFFAAFDERIPSDGTDGYILRMGFLDNVSTTAVVGAEPIDGCYFRYTDTVNSGKWELVSRRNDVETVSDSGITYTLNTRRQFGVAATTDSCRFYSSGIELAHHDTNVPDDNSRTTNAGAGFQRTAGTTLDVIVFNLDYMAVEQRPATPRNWVGF